MSDIIPVFLVYKTTEDQIIKEIMKRMKSHMVKSMDFAKHDILRRLKDVVEKAIKDSEEYRSLLGGRLQGELGVPDSAPRLERLLEIWLNEIEISKTNVVQSGDKFAGGFKVSIVKEKMREVLNSPEASYQTAKGQTIPWLSWLLEAGDATIIRDYDVSFNINLGDSRSQIAIMVGGDGKSWAVPGEFSGTIGNNFVTRALAKVVPTIEDIIKEEVMIQAAKP